jgi:sugar transferase
VNGRNSIGWDERLALDVWYVDHQSFWLDLKVLAATCVAVFKVWNVSAPGHATMPNFMGSSRPPVEASESGAQDALSDSRPDMAKTKWCQSNVA